MRLLVFGSRTFGICEDEKDLERVIVSTFQRLLMLKILRGTEYSVLIHGGAVGADILAQNITSTFCKKIETIEIAVKPEEWAKYGKAAGPFRNRKLITEGKPDRAFGFIDRATANDPLSPGSKNMYQQLLNNHIPVELFQ